MSDLISRQAQIKMYCRHYNVWCEYSNGMGGCGYTECLKHYDRKTYSDRTEYTVFLATGGIRNDD